MDTIKIFIETLNYNIFNHSKTIWHTVTKDNKMYYYTKYNGIYFQYIPEYFYLSMQFSLTKLLYGSNTEIFDVKDTELLFNILNTYANDVLNNIPPIEDWKVNRLDLANNYLCNSKKEKMSYINIFKDIHYSHCESSGDYKTSVHMHNKSIVYNNYDKHEQDPSADEDIFRSEIQLKNRTLNRLVKKGSLPSKNFKDIMNNLPLLNNIFKDKLRSLGLNCKFLTKEQMEVFLKKLLKKGKISKHLYQNMFNYFIGGIHNISANTLYKYKKELKKYGVSHILSATKLPSNVNFLKFNLYKKSITKPKNSLKLHSLLFLFVMSSFSCVGIFTKFILFKTYFDDS